MVVDLRQSSGGSQMLCSLCGKDVADEFKFCPHCGRPLVQPSDDVVLPISSAEPRLLPDVPNNELTSKPIVSTNSGIQAGTIVFAAFAFISLLVSLAKGLVPIYLFEGVGWAILAWYWQSKKTHSDLAKGIVGTLAIMVVFGELAHIAMQWDAQPASAPASNSASVYSGTNPNVDANGYTIVDTTNNPSAPTTTAPSVSIGDIWGSSTDATTKDMQNLKGAKSSETTSTNRLEEPDMSNLSGEEQSLIDQACFLPKGDGPASYIKCLNRQLSLLAKAPPRPDLSALNGDELSSIEQACFLAKSDGPAAYYRCLTRQLRLLGINPRADKTPD
jgi:hypothetical protein